MGFPDGQLFHHWLASLSSCASVGADRGWGRGWMWYDRVTPCWGVRKDSRKWAAHPGRGPAVWELYVRTATCSLTPALFFHFFFCLREMVIIFIIYYFVLLYYLNKKDNIQISAKSEDMNELFRNN